MTYMQTCRFVAALFLIAASSMLQTMARPLPQIGPRIVLATSSNRAPSDMCMWVHPDAGKGVMSTVITVDPKAQVVMVFDMDGRVIDSHRASRPEGIDLRYNFPMGRERIDIVAFLQCRSGNRLIVMKVDPKTRKLLRVDDNKILTGKALGGCLYQDVKKNRFYYIAACQNGKLKWFELKNDGKGRISGKLVSERQYVYTAVQGIVADDDYGRVYFSERTYGLWSASANPLVKEKATLIHKAGTQGLERDVEGVGIYPIKGGGGYIVVASESNNRFVLFDRRDHKHVGSFLIRSVNRPEGLEVINSSVGRYFPTGVLLCTTKADNGRKKVVVTPWNTISRTFSPGLHSSSSWNPRITKDRIRETTMKKARTKVAQKDE